MKRSFFVALLLFCGHLSWSQATTESTGRWTAARANAWYATQPFLVGSNYAPAYAINQLAMFQAETFDIQAIDKELALAESIGMNTMRVFLHDLLWQQDAAGFTKRLDQFLAVCAKHRIRPMLVLFDSCWQPFPALGPQPEPTPGVHNSGWVQSPGAAALTDVSQYPRLESYVKGVVGAFKNDRRILAWDLWNEPDNTNATSYGEKSKKQNIEPANKVAIVTRLLPEVFRWARSAKPAQPLTAGVWQFWNGNWADLTTLTAIDRVQLEQSDIITFHQYADSVALLKAIAALKKLGRPLICTDYMARGAASKFQTHLPIAKREKVGMINWGFVAGKTQTYLPWDSWDKPYVDGREPTIWFHEVYRNDLTPYDQSEITAIRQATGKQ